MSKYQETEIDLFYHKFELMDGYFYATYQDFQGHSDSEALNLTERQELLNRLEKLIQLIKQAENI